MQTKRKAKHTNYSKILINLNVIAQQLYAASFCFPFLFQSTARLFRNYMT
jgi:hypothetical protein